jgi:hypothetical protein
MLDGCRIWFNCPAGSSLPIPQSEVHSVSEIWTLVCSPLQKKSTIPLRIDQIKKPESVFSSVLKSL